MNTKKIFLLLFLSIHLSVKPINLPTSKSTALLSFLLPIYPTLGLMSFSRNNTECAIVFLLTYPFLTKKTYDYFWDYTEIGEFTNAKNEILRIKNILSKVLPEGNNYDEGILEHLRNYYSIQKFPLAYANSELCNMKDKYEKAVKVSNSLRAFVDQENIKQQKEIVKNFDDNYYSKLIQAITTILKSKSISKEIRASNLFEAKMKSVEKIEGLKPLLWFTAAISSANLFFLYCIIKRLSSVNT